MLCAMAMAPRRSAVDHEGEVLEGFARKRRDRKAALKILKRTMKRYGRPWAVVTDRLRSHGAALKAAAHASIHNHFNQIRHLNRRDIFKQNRAAALAEWHQLTA